MSITLDGTTGIVAPAIDVATPITVSDGGTGTSTLTSNNVLLGAGTSAVTFVAPGSSGNVLTSDGSTWTSAAAGGGQLQTEVFTAPGTWTKPASATQVTVTVIGGGGGSGSPNTGVFASSGATSSFGPAVSATGGGGGRGSPTLPGTPGTGTVSVGTALRTTTVATFPNLIITSHWLVDGPAKSTSSSPAAEVYSISASFGAGRGGINPSAGGGGGFASAIVPVSAPVTITIGAGGAGAVPLGIGGIGGAVVVEFVG
jgi:hypothetical protein